MADRTEELREAWGKRSERLGATKRAVLFKRFPGWLNERIHRRHVDFVLRHCPAQAASVLDIGCGYGRISAELANERPSLEFQGVDLCTGFARAYEAAVGPCFNGPVQAYTSERRFDCILVITTLMYLSADEQDDVLTRLRGMLAPGGVLICIEPASEIFATWRRLTGRASASPTGGSVAHFPRGVLRDRLLALEGVRLAGEDTIMLLPFCAATALHHAAAVRADGGQG